MILNNNLILNTDSYKLGHFEVYPEWVKGMYSYITARVPSTTTIVPFGALMWVLKNLRTPITLTNILEAEEFALKHGEPFNKDGWTHILLKYGGYLPLTIRAIPEGTPVPGGTVLVTVECTDPVCYWLPSYIETTLQRTVWYGSTIATRSYEAKRDIAHFYRISGGDSILLNFALHDFGSRGVSSGESAEIGGAAHLAAGFLGSDNIEGIRAANYYYKDEMAAFSVRATEHSVECSYGGESAQEEEYLRQVLTRWAKPGQIVSIVIDGYDMFRATDALCSKFKDLIVNSGAKVVFRPDSGDMMETVPYILQKQAEAFGMVLNSKRYHKINNVGVIQGDGVNNMSIKSLLGKILSIGFSADNVVFGSGGALLQQVNRDTFRFAQKTSALFDGTNWYDSVKAPVTDKSKSSLGGRLSVARSKLTGEYINYRMDSVLDSEYEDQMVVLYDLSSPYKLYLASDTLSNIRKRCEVSI